MPRNVYIEWDRRVNGDVVQFSVICCKGNVAFIGILLIGIVHIGLGPTIVGHQHLNAVLLGYIHKGYHIFPLGFGCSHIVIIIAEIKILSTHTIYRTKIIG